MTGLATIDWDLLEWIVYLLERENLAFNHGSHGDEYMCFIYLFICLFIEYICFAICFYSALQSEAQGWIWLRWGLSLPDLIHEVVVGVKFVLEGPQRERWLGLTGRVTWLLYHGQLDIDWPWHIVPRTAMWTDVWALISWKIRPGRLWKAFVVFVLFGIALDGSRIPDKPAMFAEVLQGHMLKASSWAGVPSLSLWPLTFLGFWDSSSVMLSLPFNNSTLNWKPLTRGSVSRMCWWQWPH